MSTRSAAPAAASSAREWLRELGWPNAVVTPEAGDVSLRRYFRVRDPDAYLAYYPPELSDSFDRFVRADAVLRSHAIPVPEVLAKNAGRGLMLLEHAGSQSLYDRHLGGEPVEQELEVAIAIVARLRAIPASAASFNPPLGSSSLFRELVHTWEAFLVPRGVQGTVAEQRLQRRAWSLLCRRLGRAPSAVSHRDFMARNLMVPRPHSLVVIDHQDLRTAPDGYDLASLLNDSLFATEAVETRALIALHLDPETYHRCAAQRTLKIVGTFARFAQRGNRRHLSMIPTALASCLRHLRALPEGRELEPVLRRLWQPMLATRDSSDRLNSQ